MFSYIIIKISYNDKLKGVFVWDFLKQKKITFSSKKLAFVYLNFFKNNQNLKKYIFNFFFYKS